jgi:signal transduction histidine kinase
VSFRARLFLAFAVAVLLPLGALAVGVRREMERRLGAEYRARVSEAVETLRSDVVREGSGVERRLAALAGGLAADNRFRLAVVQGDPAARRDLLDWGGGAMRVSGLDLLELQDSSGRILSSGHFRNEFDRIRPPASLVGARAAPMLVRVRRAEGDLLALARSAGLSVAGRPYTQLGGVSPDRLLRPAAGDPGLSVRLTLPDEPPLPSSGAEVVRGLAIPFVDLAGAARQDSAHLLVVQSGAALADVRQSLDRWFLGALGLSMALGLGAAAWLSSRVSRPLSELAARTEAIDLERLDQVFSSGRRDEIGALSRVMDAMMARLRSGAGRLREAERRVAMGDLARQVNHDVRNGLAPIRNVLRHLDEVAGESPDALATVYGERRGTLESSVAYLETLARNYARLTPAMGRELCDVNAVVAEVVRAAPPGRTKLCADVAAGLPSVPADRVALRRVLENLVGNAVESLANGEGSVTVSTAHDGAGAVRVVVADTGPGMTRAQLDRAFDDFYTTKSGGTGLGLSIVRRLVLDLGGALRVDTAPGEGTRVTVELPAEGESRG